MLRCLPQRYIFIILAHFGFFLIYATRMNLNVALVAMVNSTYANVEQSNDPECGKVNQSTKAMNNVSIVFHFMLKIYNLKILFF